MTQTQSLIQCRGGGQECPRRGIRRTEVDLILMDGGALLAKKGQVNTGTGFTNLEVALKAAWIWEWPSMRTISP